MRRRRQGGGDPLPGGHLALLGRRKGFSGSGLGQPEHMARGVQKLAISVPVAIRRRRLEGVVRQKAVASRWGGVCVCAPAMPGMMDCGVGGLGKTRGVSWRNRPGGKCPARLSPGCEPCRQLRCTGPAVWWGQGRVRAMHL